MDRIGVAQIVHSLEIGGMERVAAYLAMESSPAYRPLVICLTIKGHFAPQVEAAGIEVIELHKRAGVDLRLPQRLARILKERNIQIVHAHNSGPMFTGTLAGRLARVKGIIVTDHSRQLPERFRVMATEWVMSRLADEIVSVSEHNKIDLVERLHWPADKIKVIANGVVETPPISPECAAALRQEFGITPRVPVILSAARLEPQKNMGALVAAAALLRGRGLPVKVLLVGEGSERPFLERQIAQNGLQDQVVLTGFRLDALALYRVADIFALPSRWEGLPMSILEAMSAKIPIVSTDVGDVNKAVKDGRNGLLVPSGDIQQMADGLYQLLTNKAQRRQFGEAGYQIWHDQYSVAQMVKSYEELYARYV